MAIRMISADMDGTLLDPNKRITPRTKQAVRAAMDSGALFVLNSGRMPQSVFSYAEELAVNAPIICFNGALTYDSVQQRAVDAIPMAHETARRILTEAENQNLYVQAFWGDHFYCEKYTAKTDFYEKKASVIACVTGEKLSRVLPGDVYKLLIIVDEGQMPSVLSHFGRAFQGAAACAASSSTFLEIVAPGANKGSALMTLGASRGIAPSEIMAFGDELNDLSMITAAGEGYAMANAPEQVRRQARFIAPSNSEDGLAQVLERTAAQGLFAQPREG